VVEGGTTQQQPEDAAALAARKARLFYIFTYISTTTATSTSTTFSSKLAHMCLGNKEYLFFSLSCHNAKNDQFLYFSIFNGHNLKTVDIYYIFRCDIASLVEFSIYVATSR
jgi:hypothetical protein